MDTEGSGQCGRLGSLWDRSVGFGVAQRARIGFEFEAGVDLGAVSRE